MRTLAAIYTSDTAFVAGLLLALGLLGLAACLASDAALQTLAELAEL